MRRGADEGIEMEEGLMLTPDPQPVHDEEIPQQPSERGPVTFPVAIVVVGVEEDDDNHLEGGAGSTGDVSGAVTVPVPEIEELNCAPGEGELAGAPATDPVELDVESLRK